MLEFVPSLSGPSAADLVFAFDRFDAIGSLMAGQGEPWRRSELERHFPDRGPGVYIGLWRGVPAYAVDLAGAETDPMQHARGSLYSLLGRVEDGLFSAHGRAMQLLRWRRENRYCGACGSDDMQLGDSGRAIVCGSCGLTRYPQLAPCAIVLVTRGRELLLAQAAGGRAKSFYSTLAGFIEPGESAEQAVAREVEEEVGIQVEGVEYFGSQPWPFPSQLMLGFFARYAGGDIRPDPTEIADAQWFTPEALPPVPPRVSISGQLIHQFIAQEARGV